MGSYPTTPRSSFLAWCQAHEPIFTTNAAAIGLSEDELDAFKTAVAAAAAAESEATSARITAKSLTADATTKFSALRKTTSQTVGIIKLFAESSGNANVYTLAQIPSPTKPSAMPPPGQPGDMAVSISPTSGAITLKWKCTNPPGASGTSYIIRRKLPNQANFEFLGVTGKKTYTDSSFAAGPDSVHYTVQAQRSDKAGPVSQILTINFGTAGGGGGVGGVDAPNVTLSDAEGTPNPVRLAA